MRVLFIGHYRDCSGWGDASLNYIQALDRVGVDVVCRPIKLNHSRPILPERVLELEKRPLSNIDIVIQHVLPHHMDYNSKFKNVALYATETFGYGS